MKLSNRPIRPARPTLGDLIAAVSSSCRNRRETLAALTDLFESGRVTLPHSRARIRLS